MSDSVDRLTVSVYTVPTDRPEADGTLAWDHTTLVVVQAHAGRASGLGWTYGSPTAAALIRGELATVVEGRDVFDTGGAHEALRRTTRNLGRPGLAIGAISAIDTALWDLKARLLDVSLVALLGGAPDTAVPVYGSGGFTTYDDATTAAQLRSWTEEQGIPRVKIKIGEDWGANPARDLSRIRLARDVVGDDVELYVDANGAYGPKQAIRIADAFRDQRVTWFEEPVSSDDLAGLRQVRDAVLPDVTAGEYGYDPHQFLALAGAVDCVQADATRCGGVTGWLRAAAVAAAANRDVSAHCSPALHVPLAAAVPNCRHVEWFHDHVRIESRLFAGAPDPRGGTARAVGGTEPGLGLRLCDEAMAHFRTG
ncbi:MAG: mandelate racemase [Streptomycetaceae bacterium]|nr:mandelate racemase [Streptomycetaceae bacterium]